MSDKPISLPPRHQDQPPGLEIDMTPLPEDILANYRGSGKLESKVDLITGGNSGIGQTVAVHFAREGADAALSHMPQEQPDAAGTESLVLTEGRCCPATCAMRPSAPSWQRRPCRS